VRALATTLTLICALALAVAVAGCGGGDDSGDSHDSDTQEIKDVQAKFETSIEEKDTETFCDLLAPSFVEKIGGHEACLKQYGVKNNVFFRADDTDMSVTHIDFDEKGEAATAYLANKGFIYYRKENGNWYAEPFER
jgi:hypothetical protein